MKQNKYSIIKCLLLCIALLTGLIVYQPTVMAKSENTSPVVTVLTINGAIGPAVQDYVERGIKESEKLKANAIVLTMDTPGGLDASMRGIIKAILHSPVPVISYVYPSGARAASAGTYILYASHIAAMAPGTNLGAATPVSIVSPEKQDKKNEKEKKDNASTLKAINDAKAYIRSLAQLRGRNEKWAEKAVTQAVSLSATEALKSNIINFVSPSILDLLSVANGKTVLVNHAPTKINTAHVTLLQILPNWRNKILSVITDPSIAYILLMVGVYGIFFEFMNPGYVALGVIGAIALFLALYAFQLLPINYVGFILIVFGIIFMVAEVFFPSFGALGLGGIVSFVIGSFLLFDAGAPGFTLPWQLITGVTIASALLLIGSLQLLLCARRKPVVSGTQTLIGDIGIIEQDADHCWVIVNGERWGVKSKDLLYNKQSVQVLRVDGLTLIVKAIED
ncbi:MAG: nodulation protein NfeD [Coxiellaceae bacterium]|nr:nodulation protein NfeD [Coxiellaceae bacterium]